MAAKGKAKLAGPLAKQTPDYIKGVFAALEAMRAHGHGGLQQAEVVAVAAALEVPALFVEAAMAYEHEDVVALGEWWRALGGVA